MSYHQQWVTYACCSTACLQPVIPILNPSALPAIYVLVVYGTWGSKGSPHKEDIVQECSRVLLGDFGHESGYHCCSLSCFGVWHSKCDKFVKSFLGTFESTVQKYKGHVASLRALFRRTTLQISDVPSGLKG